VAASDGRVVRGNLDGRGGVGGEVEHAGGFISASSDDLCSILCGGEMLAQRRGEASFQCRSTHW
jgi:hypothetical protein